MALMRGPVAVALLGLALFATGVCQAQATEADPSVWGVYARLVGTGWKGEFGTRATRWGEGSQMIEDDSTFGQSVITPGPTPGTLTLKLGSTGLHTFHGTIASDGAVLWVREGMLKMPYRVLLRDGQLVEESVKLSGREVASVKRAMRYEQVDGPRSASRSTPVPIAGPTSLTPVANVSTADGAAATSMAVVPGPARLPQASSVAASQPRAPLPRPKSGATSSEIATWFIAALDSGNWAQAAKELGVQPAQLKKTWNGWASLRGSESAWSGPASVEQMRDKNGQLAYDLIVLPILRTKGHMVVEIEVAAGKVVAIDLVPDYALYGPYAAVPNKSHRWPEGSTSSWYISPSGGSVVYEVRGPTGALVQMQLVKSVGNGSLVMLRSAGCPDNVCGQAGTLHDGIVSWREPKASGGYSGGYMDVKVWFENNALVSFTTDPAPNSGVQIYDQYPQYEYLRPKPMPVELQPAVAYTPEQIAESSSKVAALEPLIEIEVAKAMAQQAAIGQKFADERARRQRSSERVRSFNRAMESMNGVLTAANEVATENAARSTAELNATIAQMNAQAATQAERKRAPGGGSPQAMRMPQAIQARPASSSAPASYPASQPNTTPTPSASVAPVKSGPIEMFVFFVNQNGKTIAFEGPLALTRAEGNALKARLAGEAPGRYGAGATVDARSRGGGWCAFVYQRPGDARYIMGSETTLATTTNAMKSMVKNLNAVIHHDVVCPENS